MSRLTGSVAAVFLLVVLVGGCATPIAVPPGSGSLSSLAVADLPLRPSFAPDEHDYGVPCQTGTNSLTVSAAPADGQSVQIVGAGSDGTVSVAEGGLVEIDAVGTTGTLDKYWIRCLPHDFPDLEAVRYSVGTPGWFLLAPGLNQTSSTDHYVVMVDDHGAVVWYHNTGGSVINAMLLPDGNLGWMKSSGAAFGTDPNAAFEEHDINGNLVRTWRGVDTPADGHDFQVLANGDAMIGSYHQRTNVDVSALGLDIASPATVLDAWLQEIRPDGTLAWEWHSEDHLSLAETTAQHDGVRIVFDLAGVPTVDLVHLNSWDIDPTTGDVLISGRHLDAVMKIRRAPGATDDGNVLWKLGGSTPTDPNTTAFTILNDPDNGPARQHDARQLSNGHVTMFDNRTAKTGQPARAVEYAVDQQQHTATLVASVPAPDGNPACCLGSTRRQDDGSVVVGWGSSPPLLTEYNAKGTRTLVLSQNPPSYNYRVVKLPTTSFSRDELRTSADHIPN